MNITLKKIEVKNFKKYAEATFDFNNKDAMISGKNGYGKSTVLNAFLWCLTGKDIDGKTDGTSIRPIGQPVEVTPIVTAVLTIDGSDTVFERQLQATFSGRGENKVYKGDSSVCYIDQVPKNVTEFSDYLNNIFPYNPSMWLDVFFFNDDNKLKPEERRQILIDTFGGNITDEVVANTDPIYAELMQKKGNRTVPDYILALKEIEKACTAELGRGKTIGTLQARIDEASKAITNPLLNEETITKEIDEINKKISDTLSASALTETGYDKLKMIRNEITAVNLEIQKELQSEKDKRTKELREKLLSKNSLLFSKDAERRRQENAKESAMTDLEKAQKSIETVKSEIDALNAEQPNIETVCPTCGRKLPKAKIDEAIANYNENKSISMSMREEQIQMLEKIKTESEKAAEDASDKIAELNIDLKKLADDIKAIEMEIAKVDTMEYAVPPAILAEKKEKLLAEAKALEEEIAISGNREKTKQAVEELQAQLRIKQSELSEAQNNARQTKRIAELREKQAITAAELSNAQRLIALAQQFEIAKAKFIEQSISAHFNGITFQLFDVYKNGEVKNSCKLIMDHKPYRLLSFSQKTIASVAVINGFAKHFGFYTPIFIDNCSEMDSESMNKLKTDSQRIIIKVTDGDFAVQNI